MPSWSRAVQAQSPSGARWARWPPRSDPRWGRSSSSPGAGGGSSTSTSRSASPRWSAARACSSSRATKRRARLPDALGVVLLIASVALFALAIVEGAGWGLSGPRTLASLAGGALLFVCFVLRSRTAASPAVDLSLVSNPTYRLANMATFAFAIAFTAMFFNFVFFLTQRWAYTLFQAGLAITPGPLVVIPVAIVGGRIADRRGHRAVLVAGGLVFALGGALLYSAIESPPDFLRTWLPRALVTGTGVGLVLPSLSGAAVHGLPPGRLALGSAINQAVRQLGSVIGVGLVIALLGRTDPSGEIAAFRTIAAILVAGGVLTSLVCLGVKTAPRAAPLVPVLPGAAP